MFSVVVKTERAERKFDTLALRARDLDPPLGKFGSHLRKRALERYKAQDFVPLAPSTIEKREQKGIQKLERKLHRDVRRAVARARAGAPPGLLARLLGASTAADPSVYEGRAVKNRLAVLAEFQHTHRRGGDLVARTDLTPLSFKQQLSLSGREQRALANEVGRPILGKLPGTLVIEKGRGTVTLASRTRTGWSDVHNEGGTAGQGAKEPKRETVAIDESDLDLFEALLVEHHLVAFEER